jgi:hypothetical protein
MCCLRLRQLIRLPWLPVNLVLLLTSTPAGRTLNAQGHAVAIHNAILRSGPSNTSRRLDLLHTGDVLTLLPHGHRTGYYRVSTADEGIGWVTESAVRILDATEIHQPANPNAVAPGDPPLNITVVSGAFDGCGLEGDPKPTAPNFVKLEAWNRLKNRSAVPADADVDAAVTLAKLLGDGSDDTDHFDTARAADITGYVLHVKPGGRAESTNCRKGDPVHRDAHIELTLSPTDTAENRRVIIEVTPRWRAALKDANIDWATTTLQQTIEGKWVRVRGWLFFDGEHKSQAENTNPGNESNWRATVWEIHPVTSLRVMPHP